MAPQPPVLQVVSNSTLLVAWSAVPGAEHYGVVVHDGEEKFVDWPTKSLKEQAKDANVGNATSVLVEGLKPGVPYKAQVAARCAEIWSTYSNFSAEVKLNMLPTPEPPKVEAVNDTMIAVCWSGMPGADMYDVIIDDGEEKHVNWQTNCLQNHAIATMAGSNTSILVKGLHTNVFYKAKVAMRMKGTWSEYSGYSSCIRLRTQSLKRPREAECVICMNRPACVAMDPCGHVCACEQCSATLVNCPMCRGRIGKKLRVYA
jgi:hypothetical protein